jgi:hypothetical protein
MSKSANEQMATAAELAAIRERLEAAPDDPGDWFTFHAYEDCETLLEALEFSEYDLTTTIEERDLALAEVERLKAILDKAYIEDWFK